MYNLNVEEETINNISIFWGIEEKKALEILNVSDDNIHRVEENVAYCSLDNTVMCNLSGVCRLLFIGGKLSKITFVPSLKEYIRELKKISREGLYLCVDKGFSHIKGYMDSLEIEKKDEMRNTCLYKKEKMNIVLRVDPNHESVYVVMEESNE